MTVDRQCGSSQQSLHFAVAGVVAGHYDVVVAGGVESMSRTPMGASLANGGNPYGESFKARYTQTPNQGVGAEMIAEQWGFRPHRSSTSFRCVRMKRPRPHRIPVRSRTRSSASRTKDADGNETVVLEDERHPPRRHAWSRWPRSSRLSAKTV